MSVDYKTINLQPSYILTIIMIIFHGCLLLAINMSMIYVWLHVFLSLGVFIQGVYICNKYCLLRAKDSVVTITHTGFSWILVRKNGVRTIMQVVNSYGNSMFLAYKFRHIGSTQRIIISCDMLTKKNFRYLSAQIHTMY